MAFAIKTTTQVQAWELGAGSDMEKEMLRNGKIIAHADGSFEVFTKEATGNKGQIASSGDFFKVDERGFPCPNKREFFLQNHQHLEGNWFIQITRPLKIWRLGDPECKELHYLLDKSLLSIHPEDKEHCFCSSLWGTTETAAADAVIVFYSIKYDLNGEISEVDFNFVDAVYFSTHYQIVPL